MNEECVDAHGRLVVGPLPELVHQLGAEQDHPVERVGDLEPGHGVLLEQNQDVLVSRDQVLSHSGHEHALVGVLELGGGVLREGREDVVKYGAGGGLVLLGEGSGGHAVNGYAAEEAHHGEDRQVVALEEVNVGLLLRVLGPVRCRHHYVLEGEGRRRREGRRRKGRRMGRMGWKGEWRGEGRKRREGRGERGRRRGRREGEKRSREEQVESREEEGDGRYM